MPVGGGRLSRNVAFRVGEELWRRIGAFRRREDLDEEARRQLAEESRRVAEACLRHASVPGRGGGQDEESGRPADDRDVYKFV